MKSFVLFFILTVSLFKGESLFGKSLEDVFTSIYKKAHWGKNENGEGSSGGGSTVEVTAEYRAFLQHFMEENKITSVIDVGCGDWEFSKLINWRNIKYTGYDIVKPIIEKNKIQFETDTISFIHGNAIKIDLPEADLLICKEVLQHLSNKEIALFLKQLPKFKYAILVNDVDRDTLTSENRDIASGGYRLLDLRNPPFSLKAMVVFNYQAPDPHREMKQVLLFVNEGKIE